MRWPVKFVAKKAVPPRGPAFAVVHVLSELISMLCLAASDANTVRAALKLALSCRDMSRCTYVKRLYCYGHFYNFSMQYLQHALP